MKNTILFVLVACEMCRNAKSFHLAPTTTTSMKNSLNSRHKRMATTAVVLSPDVIVSPVEGTRGALSLSIEELGMKLGGLGRGKIAWDCYSIGIDPQLYFSGQELEESEELIQRLRPSSRRSQRLGKEALDQLNQVNGGTPVEGGIATLSHVSRSRDGTTKLLLKLKDGFEVETVLIPWKNNRTTVCVSSQVGCRQGCTFCATGRMGKLRSLTSDEILSQMFFAVKLCRQIEDLPPVSNVVFMGMGEPGDNVEHVVMAAETMTRRDLFQLSAQRVTISTVAPTPDTFRQLAAANCVLAWSVHAARDDLRRKLVPTTKYSMSDLRQGLIDALLSRSQGFRTTMLEVALMHQINDSIQEADELADFCQKIINQVPGCKLIVNLIPFNDIGQELYEKPTKENVEAFQKRLRDQGIYACTRTTRGDDESAACGQLATKKRKEISLEKAV